MPIVIGPDATEFISLDEVKRQANVSSTTSDDELDLFRGAAQEAVEGLIGPVLRRTVTEVHPAGSGAVVLRQRPVLSVDVVTAAGSAAAFTADAASGTLSTRAGWYGPVTVTYTVGRPVVPDSVRVAALIIAEHLWATQRGAAPSPYQDDVAAPSVPVPYSIPNRAVDLLRPYMAPPAVG